jgi:hypothetical protein
MEGMEGMEGEAGARLPLGAGMIRTGSVAAAACAPPGGWRAGHAPRSRPPSALRQFGDAVTWIAASTLVQMPLFLIVLNGAADKPVSRKLKPIQTTVTLPPICTRRRRNVR